MDKTFMQKSEPKAGATATPAASQQTRHSQESPVKSADARAAEEKPKNSQIVRNTSKAGDGRFGYNYASLADIADQGFTIPKMRIKPIFNQMGELVGEWLEYQDEEGEWQLGSRIIEAELKNMNPMQSRGSAETYARRYTTQLALGIAGQDDKQVESDGIARRQEQRKQAPKSDPRLDFNTIRETCAGIDDQDSLEDYWKEIAELKPSKGALPYITDIFKKRKEELTNA